MEMSHPHYPFDRSFHSGMSDRLLRLAANFKMDDRAVPWEELISSDTIMNELAHSLARSGWPPRTFEEIRKELLRLHGRWQKVKLHKSESYIRLARKNSALWLADSEDEDDLFMPSTKVKTTASSKAKSSTSTKGKRSASTEEEDDAFM